MDVIVWHTKKTNVVFASIIRFYKKKETTAAFVCIQRITNMVTSKSPTPRVGKGKGKRRLYDPQKPISLSCNIDS